MTGAASEPVVVEVTIGAPVEVVWQSLRDPELIRLWHGWHYDQLDAEIEVIFVKDASADDAAHTLQLSDGDRFELLAADGETTVRITRAPFVAGSEWSDYYDEITEGWLSFLQQLRFMHEVHPHQRRRTVFLAGCGTAGALSQLALTLPSPAGEVRFETTRQRGVELPQLGPGLLITAVKPAAADQDPLKVDAMAIVTTYGLSDQDFERERDSWIAWWRSAFPNTEDPQT